MKQTITEIKNIWNDFEEIPIDTDECIENDFYIWEKGTEKFYIWQWFDEKLPKGLNHFLLKLNTCKSIL